MTRWLDEFLELLSYQTAIWLLVFGVVFPWAGALFHELSGFKEPPTGDQPKGRKVPWFEMLVGVSVVFAVSFRDETLKAVGIGSAILGAVLSALLLAAWRQRLREGRIYRDLLRSFPLGHGRSHPRSVDRQSRGGRPNR